MTANLKNEIYDLFLEKGSVLKGHFILSSGLHSDTYMQSALLLQYPDIAEKMGRALAANFPGHVETVLSPALGGLIIGQEVARAKKCRAIFSEKDDQGKPVLRRGFSLEKGEKVLVIEDVITTGLSTNEVATLVKAAGADLIGIGSIVDRDEKAARNLAEWKKPIHSLIRVEASSWTPEACELCEEGKLPPIKPGSRKN